MALAIDGSTPAIASSTGAAVTASFTPPSGSLLVALIGGDGSTAGHTFNVTDSLSGTWTKVDNQNGTTGGHTMIAYRSGTGSSMTVTATNTDSATSTAMKVLVITGNTPTIGATNNTGNVNPTTSPGGAGQTMTGVTTTHANTLVAFATADFAAAGVPSSTDLTIFTYNIGPNFLHGLHGYKAVAAAGAVTGNYSTVGANLDWTVAEIYEAGAAAVVTLTARQRAPRPLPPLRHRNRRLFVIPPIQFAPVVPQNRRRGAVPPRLPAVRRGRSLFLPPPIRFAPVVPQLRSHPSRRRVAAIRRGRLLIVPPPQAAPAAPTFIPPTRSRPVRLLPAVRRSTRTFPLPPVGPLPANVRRARYVLPRPQSRAATVTPPPQFPPFIPPTLTRHAPLIPARRRSSTASFPPPQAAPVAPTPIPSNLRAPRRILARSRAQAPTPVPPIQFAPFPPATARHRPATLPALRRSTRALPVPPGPTPLWVRLRRGAALPALRRPSRVSPVPAIPTVPPPATVNRHRPAWLPAIRRPSRVSPVPPIQFAPYPQPNRRARLLRWWVARRGRFSFPVQAPPPPPPYTDPIPGMGRIWLLPYGPAQLGVASAQPITSGTIRVSALTGYSIIDWAEGGTVRAGSPAQIRLDFARLNASDQVTRVRINPTAFTCTVTAPDGTVTTYVKADFITHATGIYTRDITGAQSGTYKVECTAAATSFVDELGDTRSYFEVLPTAYLPVDP